jgi:UDP-N-acetylmuramoyl-L-alanyl-D-glutamate--2,6-diaminopimelate ligase
MRLRHLLEALSDYRVDGDTDLDIHGIAYDSRQVAPGTLFVAVPTVGQGPLSGGYRFIGNAVAAGATAVVMEPHEPLRGVTAIHVPDARAALADLADAFFDHPSRRLQVFAVTGTDGKTTTSYLLDGVLTAAGLTTGLIGTVETKIGDRREPNTERMTTPEALDLQRLLRSMADAGVTHVAMEASSHALVLQRLRACRFAAVSLTNITGDHVEFHGSWEAYVEAKSLLFTDVGGDAPAILNRDDPHFGRIAALARGSVTSYSTRGKADVEARRIEIGERDTHFTLVAGGCTAPVYLPLPGLFNISNALAAAGMALAAGLSLEQIADGLSHAQPPPGRMERVTGGQPFEVVVDYAHTVNAFRSVLSTLREQTPPPGRLIAVFGATGDRDRGKRPLLARIARQYADFFIITNEDPFGEGVEEIIAEVASGAPQAEEGVRFEREPDRGRAIARALERAGQGDTVAILGKGHERSIVVNGRREPWNDVAAVRAALGLST